MNIQVDGSTTTIKLREDRTFSWPYKVEKPVTAVVSIGREQKRIRLEPYEQKQPTVFFVVDRTVYRPGHELQFAAYLRQRDVDGEFQPLPDRDVEVKIKSAKKKTAATTLKLKSDRAGGSMAPISFRRLMRWMITRLRSMALPARRRSNWLNSAKPKCV